MPIKKCRVCGHHFWPEPLISYKNMPKSAQFFPDSDSLAQEDGVDLEVCQCAGCGLVQLNCDPVPYYREVIRAAAYSPEMKEFRIGQFQDFVKKYRLKNRKIIEIGCGRGEYLSLMAQCCVKVSGIEYGAESVKYCRSEQLDVSKQYIQSRTKLKNAPFDAFFILNFLEHMPNPNSALRGICANLTTDGVGIVEVPNFDMIIRNKLFSEFISDHLLYFTGETLKTTLNNNGFEVVEQNNVWHEYIISAVVRKKRQLNLSDFRATREKLKHELTTFIAKFAPQKVAIWGAGHQALAVISMTALADKIAYVIDSAPFKQGKFTPASHLPIVAPKKLESEPVEAVIVMAAAYSDEVYQTLNNKFGDSISIAIVRDYGLETKQ